MSVAVTAVTFDFWNTIARVPEGAMSEARQRAVAAGAFRFVLQTLALQTTAYNALPVALTFGLAAAGLAWHQSKR